jgi:hypothetical protein
MSKEITIGIVSAYRTQSVDIMLKAIETQTIISKCKVKFVDGTPDNYETIKNKYKELISKYDCEFISNEGGPSKNRQLIIDTFDTEYCILLDDDTIPQTNDTLEKLLNSYKENQFDVLGGVWDCQKTPPPGREYGQILYYNEDGELRRNFIRDVGIHQVHIPMATFIIKKGTPIKFDTNIQFFGEMLDFGIYCSTNDISVGYDSNIRFNHYNIPDDFNYQSRHINGVKLVKEKWGIK